MQVLVYTDHNVQGGEEFSHLTEAELRTALHRYVDEITRVEVYFSDENGAKSGDGDKRCLIEAHLAGHQPLTARHDAATSPGAFDGAARKMAHLLESTLGRLHHHKGEASIRTENVME
ncbi:MAG: HPF/RaiA family ribosome-associated protein [Rhizomicrobium sp.]